MKKAQEETVSLTFTQQTDNKTLSYEGSFTLSESKTLSHAQVLHNGELARLYLDGKYLGIQMWKPYCFACSQALTPGAHTLRVEITAGLSSQPTVAPTSAVLQLI